MTRSFAPQYFRIGVIRTCDGSFTTEIAQLEQKNSASPKPRPKPVGHILCVSQTWLDRIARANVASQFGSGYEKNSYESSGERKRSRARVAPYSVWAADS